jgi:hypothetical protein
MDDTKKLSDFLKELKKDDDDAKKNIEGDKFRNRHKILADTILEANVADKLRLKQSSSRFYYGGDITQDELSTLNMSGDLLPKGFADDSSVAAVGALSVIPGDFGKAASAASKIATKVLDVVAPFDKRLGSARAKAQGVDIFADNQYIVNNNYPEDDPRRYEINYAFPYNPSNIIHIDKDDQTRYLMYQFYVARLGNNIPKWRPFLSKFENDYLFPTDRETNDKLTALTRLHGH